MTGVQTCALPIYTSLKGKVELEKIISALANNPRKILGFETKVEEGADADLTLFNPELKWTFAESNIKSKSKNTPFVGTAFTGKALGIVHKGKLQLN